eukprot:6230685-Lingulodinium_polyedra.AAC.1
MVHLPNGVGTICVGVLVLCVALPGNASPLLWGAHFAQHADGMVCLLDLRVVVRRKENRQQQRLNL